MKPVTRVAILMCVLCSCAETRAQKPPPVVARPAPAAVPAASSRATFTIQLVNNKTREIMAGVTIIQFVEILVLTKPTHRKIFEKAQPSLRTRKNLIRIRYEKTDEKTIDANGTVSLQKRKDPLP